MAYEKMVALFDYDAKASLDIQEMSVAEEKNAKIHEISYASPHGGRVPAYLVVPNGKGPFPAIIFMHSDLAIDAKKQFLNEAIEFAGMGVESLMIDAPNCRNPNRNEWDSLMFLFEEEKDVATVIQWVTDLRRGIDLLSERPEIDKTRVGFVGQRTGASIGGILSGVDKRIKAYVLLGGGASITGYQQRHYGVAKEKPYFNGKIRLMEPKYYISHASPAAILFQNGSKDNSCFSADNQKRYHQIASEPKLVKWYEADYYDLFRNMLAYQERIQWLAEQLGFEVKNP